MPWEATSVDRSKMAFIRDWLEGDDPKTVICERHGISRQTGYKWAMRFSEFGLAGLTEQSRAPLQHGRAMSAQVAAKLIAIRRLKPFWGPKKLLQMVVSQAVV